jgi:hypothetical protein
MPYIEKIRRDEIKYDGSYPMNAGELNYYLTITIQDYYTTHPNYQGINDIIGALEGAKLEFYRRQVAKYEDQKIIDNGDVYV